MLPATDNQCMLPATDNQCMLPATDKQCMLPATDMYNCIKSLKIPMGNQKPLLKKGRQCNGQKDKQ
jgi:hypothetical protein